MHILNPWKEPATSRLHRAAAILLISIPFVWSQTTTGRMAVDSAPEWNRLFDRVEGWTGADGIFSIPLSGYKAPGRAEGGKTLFVFSDTWIGGVDAKTDERTGAAMIHNSLAVLDGAKPDPAKIHFLWGRTAAGKAASTFTPSTPSTVGKNAWYWLQDGFYHKGFVYILPIVCTPGGTSGWNEVGVGFIKLPIGADGEPDPANAVQKDTPFKYNGPNGSYYFGNGIMPNTAEAGAPNPDGYVYVYGRFGLYVSRVLPDDFEDFSKWRYWDGSGWNTDIGKARSLGLGGPELSVSPITQGTLKGKYLLVSMSVEQNAFFRVGDSPWGPFGARTNIYQAPEWHTYGGGVFTYNAKAHPSLSANGEWLVSYNVNTADLALNLKHADIYHPRFFTLRLEPVTGILNPAPGRLGSVTEAVARPDGAAIAERVDANGRRVPAPNPHADLPQDQPNAPPRSVPLFHPPRKNGSP
jgi:hypothetical protein